MTKIQSPRYYKDVRADQVAYKFLNFSLVPEKVNWIAIFHFNLDHLRNEFAFFNKWHEMTKKESEEDGRRAMALLLTTCRAKPCVSWSLLCLSLTYLFYSNGMCA